MVKNQPFHSEDEANQNRFFDGRPPKVVNQKRVQISSKFFHHKCALNEFYFFQKNFTNENFFNNI
jgi:hypothetical protein